MILLGIYAGGAAAVAVAVGWITYFHNTRGLRGSIGWAVAAGLAVGAWWPVLIPTVLVACALDEKLRRKAPSTR